MNVQFWRMCSQYPCRTGCLIIEKVIKIAAIQQKVFNSYSGKKPHTAGTDEVSVCPAFPIEASRVQAFYDVLNGVSNANDDATLPHQAVQFRQEEVCSAWLTHVPADKFGVEK